MFNLLDFIKIAKYLDDVNNNIFTSTEIFNSANDYLIEYTESMNQGKPTHAIQSLCEEIVMDMDFADYIGTETQLNMETVNDLLKDLLDEI